MMCRAGLALLGVLWTLACERPMPPRTATSPPAAAVESRAAAGVPLTPAERTGPVVSPPPEPALQPRRAGADTSGRFWPGQLEQDTGIGGTCRADDDCTVAPVGCCDCRAGGAQRAVPRSAVPPESICADAMCPMVISRHPSCRQVPRCIQGRCALVAPPAGSSVQRPDLEAVR
ncbi:MAG: hypothetical protein RMK29_18810 [Myxococcales bacterium]|nr:hypothetical protein [Myxococcota bacterium]MDW8283759.1 hypothetical protein [Myxococcales bacterium]